MQTHTYTRVQYYMVLFFLFLGQTTHGDGPHDLAV